MSLPTTPCPEFDQNSCVELSPLLDACGTEESKEKTSPSSSVILIGALLDLKALPTD